MSRSPVYPSRGAFTALSSKVVLGIDSSSGEAAGDKQGGRICLKRPLVSASIYSFLAETRKEYIESYRYNETDTQISGVRKFVIRGR